MLKVVTSKIGARKRESVNDIINTNPSRSSFFHANAHSQGFKKSKIDQNDTTLL